MTAPFIRSPRPSSSRDRAVQLDAADPLAAFRDRYLPQTDDVVAYLDGNSLGRPLASIAAAWTRLRRSSSGPAG